MLELVKLTDKAVSRDPSALIAELLYFLESEVTKT